MSLKKCAQRAPRKSSLATALPYALFLLGIGAAMTSGAALSQTSSGPDGAAAARIYNLPAGKLNVALDRFGRAAGIDLSYDPAILSGVSTQGVSGNYSVNAALGVLLSGTGIVAEKQPGGGYLLRKIALTGAASEWQAFDLPAVTVKASATGGEQQAYRAATAHMGALGVTSLRDTPYTVEVITRELMENKQAHTLVDAVKGDAGITSGSNYTNGTGDVLLMRGVLLSYRNNYKLDGQDLIGFLGAPQLPVEHMESIEVLKGAGGFLYGFGTPGGIVNLTLRRPTDVPVRSLTTEVTGSGTVLVHGDVGGRFGEDDRFGYRVNLVNEQGNTYVDNGGKIDRQSASVAFDWRINNDLKWSVDALHQERRVDAVYYQLLPNATGLPGNAIAAPPAAVNGSTRLASPFTYSQVRSDTFGTTLAWKINPDWQTQLSYRKWDQAMFSNHSFLYANAGGQYAEMQISLPSKVRSEQTQAIVMGSFGSADLRHDVTFGASYADIFAQESNDFRSAVVGTGTLANPGNFVDPGLNATWTPGGWNFPEQQRSVFLSDTLHVGANADFIAGARHSNFRSTTYDKSAITPTLAVVYRPLEGLSTYASYVEALEQGSVAPTTSVNANQVFAPIKSKQVEVGVKTEGENWSGSAALFRMNQALAYTTDAGVFTQDGEARYQGVELSGKLRVAQRWNILASTVFLDAANVKTSGGLYDGKRVPGASRQQYSLYSEYALGMLPATLTGGVRYVGTRALDTANNWELPGYAVFDLGARYVTRIGGTKTTLRLNIDNIGDKAYWLMAGSNRLIQGAPRTVSLSAQLDF